MVTPERLFIRIIRLIRLASVGVASLSRPTVASPGDSYYRLPPTAYRLPFIPTVAARRD